MKKLFLLPLLAIAMLFASCEKVELFDDVIEPCLDFGASSIEVKKYMSKYDVDLLEDNEDYLKFGNYCDCKYFYYQIRDGKMNMASVDIKSEVFEKTIEQIEKKYELVKTFGPNEGIELRYYTDKEKTIALSIYVPINFSSYEFDTFDIVYTSVDYPGIKHMFGW